MKWISLPAALLGCAALISPAWGVDTNRQNPPSSPFGATQPLFNPGGQFNPTAPFPSNPLQPGGGDQFLNNNLFSTTPVFPGFNPVQPGPNPGSTVPNVPVPPGMNPSMVPGNDGRSRISNPQNPGATFSPGGQQPYSQPKWRLGVYSRDTEAGVVIHEVVPGSAAASAGLEPQDTIIAVNGFQVGYVNGQLYDCGSEFERLATNDGWVRLLVLDNRASNTNNLPKLLNVPVKLESRMSNLRGTVAWQPRQNLPANAILNVELKEVLGNNTSPVTFASQQIRNINAYPTQFQIDFDPAHISMNGRYVLDAAVLVDGREIYRTTQAQRVLDQPGQNRQVALQLNQVQINNATNYPVTTTVSLDQDSQVAQIMEWFQRYLGRPATDRELAIWLDALRRGYTMSQVQADLLAHQSFFNRCDGDKRVYITKLHEMLVNRPPRQDELDYWMAQYDARKGVRLELAKDFQDALGIH